MAGRRQRAVTYFSPTKYWRRKSTSTAMRKSWLALRAKPWPSFLPTTYQTGTPFFLTAAVTCSDSEIGTLGSFCPWTIRIGVWIFPALVRGEMRSRNAFIAGSAFVAVFGPPEVATVALGVLEETHEIRDPDDVDARLDPVVIGRLDRQRHEPAIGSAAHADPPFVQVRLRGDPVQQGAYVLDGPLAELPVIQLHEGLAVPRRSSDIGHDQYQAQLVDQVVEPGQEPGAELGLGSAVDLDEHRSAAGKAGRAWSIDECRDLASVECLVVNQRGFGERQDVQPAGLALGPALGMRTSAGLPMLLVEIQE